MENIKKIVDTLDNPEVAVAVENLRRHRANKVYIEAAKLWLETQQGQIEKGAAKYPEPLNPDSWTESQLINHALQENVDQAHYLTALLQKIKFKDDLLSNYQRAIELAGKQIDELRREVRISEESCSEYAKRLDDANDMLFQSSQDIKRLDEKLEQYKKLEQTTHLYVKSSDIGMVDAESIAKSIQNKIARS